MYQFFFSKKVIKILSNTVFKSLSSNLLLLQVELKYQNVIASTGLAQTLKSPGN